MDYAQNLIRIANSIQNPLLAYELEYNTKAVHAALKPVSVVNPNIQTLSDRINSLKQLRENVLEAIDDIDMDNLAKEMDDLARADVELDSGWDQVASNKVADGMSPSYKMTDREIDEFIEGKRDWDANKQIKEESIQSKKFLDRSEAIRREFEKIRKNKKPDKKSLETLLRNIDNTLKLAPRVSMLRANLQRVANSIRLSSDENEIKRILLAFKNSILPDLNGQSELINTTGATSAMIRAAHRYDSIRSALLPFLKEVVKR